MVHTFLKRRIVFKSKLICESFKEIRRTLLTKSHSLRDEYLFTLTYPQSGTNLGLNSEDRESNTYR